MKLQSDAEFREVYKNAVLVLADGVPVMWAARFLGIPLKEKVSGSDLFPKICEVAARKGWRLFFLGGRPGAVKRTTKILKKRYPSLRIVGIHSPEFGFEKDPLLNQRVVNMVKEAQPDILFVGLGAPKQEKWIFHHYKEMNVPVSIGIGVTFEFTAGLIKRAPVWMQCCGLEWFWRLLMEPRRLWRRYLVEDIKFVGMVWRERF